MTTICKRRLRHKWPTPLAIQRKAQELEGHPSGKDLIQVAAEDWNAKGEAHRKQAFEVASESMRLFKPKAPKNFRELEAADKVARRAAGLDVGENNRQTLIMMHERVNQFEDEQPEEIIEAEVVVEDSSRPALVDSESDTLALQAEADPSPALLADSKTSQP